MKINFYGGLEKLKSMKLCKRGTSILAMGLIPMLLTTGCMSYKSSKQYNANTDITTSQTYSMDSESTSFYQQENIEEFDYEFQEELVQISKNAASLFKQEINEIKPDYKYSELYDIEKCLSLEKEDNQKPILNHNHEVLDENGKINSQKLYSIVKANNTKYLDNTDDSYYDRELFLNQMSDSEIQEACTVISDAINQQAEKVKGIDLEKVGCVLTDLKMFNTPSSMNAYVSDDNCLVVSPQMIKVVQLTNKDQDVRKDVLIHEAQHLIQKACNCEIDWDKESKIGFCKSYADLEMNPLYWKWYFESSAEQNMCNLTNDDPTVYEYMIGYLNSLKLATILDKNGTTTKLEELSLQDNSEEFYQLFGANNEEDRKEVIKMMVAIDIIQTEREDFLNKYEQSYGAMSEEELLELKRSLKGSICTTLSKCFYRNLADTLSTSQEVSLQDVYYLIKTFESQINVHLEYEQSEKREYYPEFMENYVSMQNDFFEILSSSTNYSQEELLNQMNDYTCSAKYNDKLKDPNCNLKFLDEDKKEFVTDLQKTLIGTNQESIQTIYQNDQGKVLRK